MPENKLQQNLENWMARVAASAKAANPSLKQFKGKLKLKYGLPDRIRFTFPRHYVFVEKGVGRGRKVGSDKATPKPAINPAITANLNELADIAADGMADIVVKRMFIQ